MCKLLLMSINFNLQYVGLICILYVWLIQHRISMHPCCKKRNCLMHFHPVELKEIDKTCQQIIRDNYKWCGIVTGRHMHDPCMFEEVEGCIPDGVLNDQDSFMQMFQKVNRCALKVRQRCLTHRTFCRITGDQAMVDMNVSGLPC